MDQIPVNQRSTAQTDPHGGQNYSFPKLSVIILPYLAKLWSVRKKIIVINGSIAFLSVFILLLFVNPYFDSSITILPDYGSKSSSLGGLAGLASLAGFSIGDAASPSDIYKNLLSSESVIEPVIFSRYETKAFKDSVNLSQYFDIEVDTTMSRERRERTVFLQSYGMFLKDVVTVSVDATTKILTVTIRTPESKLSSDIANNLVNSLDEYIRTKRKSNASIQLSYIEKRSADIEDSLTQAEEKLKVFLLRNRFISQSPELVLEQSRLNRQIQILQGVFVQLMQQLEIAKIDEIRDAPVLNVREWAKDPIRKTGPSKVLLFVAIMLVSMIITASYFLLYDKLRIYILKIFTYRSV